MNKLSILVIFATSLLALSKAQNIISIEAKTADLDGAGMTLGSVTFEIFNNVPFVCVVKDIDSNGLNFQPGQSDVFEGSDLEDCELFEVPDHDVKQFNLIHQGTDGWVCEYVRIFFSDGIYTTCYDGEFIDGFGETHTLNCTLNTK